MFKSDDCVDVLRLTESEQRAILDELDRPNRRPPVADQRKSPRYGYSVRGGLQVELDGRHSRFLVRPRNLSTGGISFLHGAFLYPGTTCMIALRTVDGERVLAEGRVKHCRCVHGRIHEVGVRFEDPIDVENFVRGLRASAPHVGTDTDVGRPQGDYDAPTVIRLAQHLQTLAAARAPRDELYREAATLAALLRRTTTPKKN